MNRTMSTQKRIWFDGLACDWSIYHKPEIGRIRYAAQAFTDFLKSDISRHVPILIEHDSDKRLPQLERTHMLQTAHGLECSFALDRSKFDGQWAVVAVKHGFVRHLSISTTNLDVEIHEDEIGEYATVYKANINEISMTADPANSRTWLTLSGHDYATSEKMPTDYTEQVLLSRWLDKFGLPNVIAEKRQQWTRHRKQSQAMLTRIKNEQAALLAKAAQDRRRDEEARLNVEFWKLYRH